MNYSKVIVAALLSLAAALTGCASGVVPTKHVTGTLAAHDGVPIVYEVFGEGEVAVVFVHCWACNREFWRNQIEVVVAAGYRVVTMDLPGHGQSGAGREVWSATEMVDDLETLVDALNLERTILVGHAMGANLALAVAPRLPNRVVGIGCVATLRNVEFKWPQGTAEVLAAVIATDFREGLESYVRPLLAPGSQSAFLEWIVDQAVASDQEAVLELMVDIPNMDLPELLSNATVPIRCINAAPRGRYSPPTEVEINRKYADFDVILMEGVGQYPQLENPEAFNKHLLDLLGELNRRTQ